MVLRTVGEMTAGLSDVEKEEAFQGVCRLLLKPSWRDALA